MTGEAADKSGALVLRTINDLNQALMAQRDKAHILTPFTQTVFDQDDFALGFKPSLRFVYIDKNPDHGEVYESDDRRGELAILGIGLDKLSSVAGIEWPEVRREDDQSDPLKARYHAKGRMRLVDGTYTEVTAERSMDLTDGSPEAIRMKPGQLARQRAVLAQVCESKAKNRVVRKLLGLKQSYKPFELDKPFLVLKIVPDMRDPEVRRMVQAQMLGMEKFLFMAQPEAPPALPPVAPGGSAGLELAEPPGGQRQLNSAPPHIDVQPEPQGPTAEEIRAQKIDEIKKLYSVKTKTGRDPNKPALETLADATLDAILEELKKKPDISLI